ncbi:MAG: tandem-95 repeat protein [Phycisphaerae bacterium]|nr:tandem-95 repeat protein [Phycisphaerae bacterium]
MIHAADQSVLFTPDPGYSGPAGMTVIADDGFNLSGQAVIDIAVSDAPLLSMEILNRLPRIEPGETYQLVTMGDFADEQGVPLIGDYLTYSTLNANVALVSENGLITGQNVGMTVVTASYGPRQVVTALTVGEPVEIEDIILYFAGLDIYPETLALVTGGSRQFSVKVMNEVDITAGSTGTTYHVGNSEILSVTEDGLVTALTPGDTALTIIHGPAEAVVPIRVDVAQVGPVTLGSAGGVVQGVDGSQVQVGPGVLLTDTTVSISPLEETDLPMDVPEGFAFVTAFDLDLGDEELSNPVQLAIPVGDTFAPGDTVYFLRAGTLPDATGQERPIWFQDETGVVGTDGVLRTTSPPWMGLRRSAINCVVQAATQTIVVVVPFYVIDIWMGLVANLQYLALATHMISTVVKAGMPEAVLVVPAGTQTLDIIQIPRAGLPVITTTNIDASGGGTVTLNVDIPEIPMPDEPEITGVELDLSGSQPELVITGDHFSDSNSDFYVNFQVGTQEPLRKDISPASPTEVRVTVPPSVILGLTTVWVSRVFRDKHDTILEELKSNGVRLPPPEHGYVFSALGFRGDVNARQSEVAVIDAAGNLVKRIPVADKAAEKLANAWDVAPTLDHTRVYVSLRLAPGVSVIDTMTLQEIDVDASTDAVVDYIKLPAGAAPKQIVVSDHYAYVADDYSGSIYVIDINPSSNTFNQHVKTIAVGPAPAGLDGMDISADGRRLYVAGRAARRQFEKYTEPGKILVIDTDPFDDQSPDGKNRNLNTQIGTVDLEIAPSGVTATGDPDVILFTGAPSRLGVLEATSDSSWVVTHYIGLQWSKPDLWYDLYYGEGIAITPDHSYAFVTMTGHTFWTYNDPLIIPKVTNITVGGLVSIPTVSWIVIDINDYGPYGFGSLDGGLIGVVQNPLSPTGDLVAATRPIPTVRGPDSAVVSSDGKYLFASYSFERAVFVYSVSAIVEEIKNNDVYRLDTVPINDLVNGQNAPNAPNTAIDVKADYRLDDSKPSYFAVFKNFDPNRAPINTGGFPKGLEILPQFLSLNDPEETGTQDHQFLDVPELPDQPVVEDLTPKFTWNIVGFEDVKSKIKVTSKIYVSVFKGGEGLFPSDTPPDSPLVDMNPNRIVNGEDVDTKTEFVLPNHVKLTAGQTYYWGVEATTSTGLTNRRWTSFKVAPIDVTPGNPNDYNGVIILTHGLAPFIIGGNGSYQQVKYMSWLTDMAESIAKAGGDGVVLKYDRNTGRWVDLHDSGKDARSAAQVGQPLVLLPDWAKESIISDSGFSEAAADAIFASLVQLNNELEGRLFDSPLHFIGHSRGAVVNSEIVQRLGTYFPEVNRIHMTALDPHDQVQESLDLSPLALLAHGLRAYSIMGLWQAMSLWTFLKTLKPRITTIPFSDFQDPDVTRWENISFFDNYYQTLANPDRSASTTVTPNGRMIAGADVNELLDGRAGFTEDDSYGGPHGRVLSWYAGTVDLSIREFDHEFGTFDDVMMKDPIYRSLSDSEAEVTVNGIKWDSYDDAMPWYTIPGAHSGQEIWEGIGAGWFYSSLGSGAFIGPSRQGTPVTFDNVDRDDKTGGIIGPVGDAPVPTVFNGNFEYGTMYASQFPAGRYPPWVDIPGWSFHGGRTDGFALLVEDTPDNFAMTLGSTALLGWHNTITHNRMYIPEHAWGLQFDIKVINPSNNDTLQVYAETVTGTRINLGTFDIKNETPDFDTLFLPFPTSVLNSVVTLTFELTPGAVILDSKILLDNVRFATIDVDVDSNNNGVVEVTDEIVEQQPTGVMIIVNNRDRDNDSIPDFADGFNRDGISGTDDDTPPSALQTEKFAELVITLPDTINLSQARLRLDYSDSDPNAVTHAGTAPDFVYTPGHGHLRMWAKPAYEIRNGNSFAAGSDPGDYIPPTTGATFYSPTEVMQLGFSDSNRSVTFYLEAVRASDDMADQQVTVEVDPDGGGPIGFVARDDVRATLIQAEVLNIEFVSDHETWVLLGSGDNLLRKSAPDPSIPERFDFVGDRYEEPEWIKSVGGNPGRSNPISQTKNTELAVRVTVQVQPSGIEFVLYSNMQDDYLDFEARESESTGNPQLAGASIWSLLDEITATEPLPDQIDFLEDQAIQWEFSLPGTSVEIKSDVSEHDILVTFDRPVDDSHSGMDDPDDHNEATLKRLEWATDIAIGTSTKTKAAERYVSDLGTPHGYTPNVNGGTWTLDSWKYLEMLGSNPSIRADCIMLANTVVNGLQVLGIPATERWSYATADGTPGFPTVSTNTCRTLTTKQFEFLGESFNAKLNYFGNNFEAFFTVSDPNVKAYTVYPPSRSFENQTYYYLEVLRSVTSDQFWVWNGTQTKNNVTVYNEQKVPGEPHIPVPSIPSPLLAWVPPASGTGEDTNIDASESSSSHIQAAISDLWSYVIEAARNRWTQFTDADQLNTPLAETDVLIEDLPETYLAWVLPTDDSSHIVTVDADAAGYGWFVDGTPWQDEEFSHAAYDWELFADNNSPATGLIDLLTVLMHEMGHVLGLADVPVGVDPTRLMTGALRTGVRRLPSELDYAYESNTLENPQAETSRPLSAIVNGVLIDDLAIGITNGTFGVSDENDPDFGWSVHGSGLVENGRAVLREGGSYFSGLSQMFIVPEGAQRLLFTIVSAGLGDSEGHPPDAFEVALLNADTMTSLAGTAGGLNNTDALLNIQPSGRTYFGSQVLVPGLNASGETQSLAEPITVEVDLTGVPAGTVATLYFDLLGFGDNDSQVVIDNVLIIGDGPIPPIASDDTAGTEAGQPVDIDVLTNDVDLDGVIDPATVTIVDGRGPEHGTVDVNPVTGVVTYDPEPGFAGSDSFRYTVHDNEDYESNVAIVSILVNRSPVAVDDTYTTDEDSTLQVDAIQGVLSNDSDPDNDPLSVTLSSDVSHGTLTLNDDGSFEYAPDLNFHGEDSFTYEVKDAKGGTDTATVTFTVNPVNDAPIAADNNYATDEDTELVVAAPGVLGNDSDVDGDTLTAVLDTDVSNGTLSLNTDGSFTYTPNSNFNGADSFTYHANDGPADSNIVIVTITVNAINDAPVADDDAYSTDEDTPLTVGAPGVLTNDSDPDDDFLSVTLLSDVSHGTLTLNDDGSFEYAPDLNFHGEDSFTYEVNDGKGGTDTATVTITVNPVNDAPVANDDTATTDEDTPVTIDVLANDTDVDNDTLTAGALSDPANGTATINSYGNIIYTPDPDFNGSDSFNYTVSDGNGGLDTAAVTIEVSPVNDVPVAEDQSVITDEDTPVDITLTASDVEDDPLAFEIVDGPDHGSLDLSGADVVYTPDADYHGPDSFTFRANDGELDSNLATVDITVNPVNDAPEAFDQAVETEEDIPVDIPLTGSDIEEDPLTFALVDGTVHGTLSLAGTVVTYTPDADYNGGDSFTFRVNDGELDSNLATVDITVNPVNDAPVADDQTVETEEDMPVDITLTGSDVEEDPLTFALVDGTVHGTLSLAGTVVTYTPDADYNGGDSFTFRVNDGELDSNLATVDITVNPVNDAPVADANGPYVIAAGADLQLEGSGSSDPDEDYGDSIVLYEWDINNDGAFDYTGETVMVPWADLAGLPGAGVANTVTLRVTDSFGETGTGDTQLRIFDNQPVAEFTANPNPAACNQPITFDASASAHTHPEHGIVLYEWDFESDGTFDATGETLTHTYSQFGQYTVTLRVTDDNTPAQTDTATTVMDISLGNRAPIADANGPYVIDTGADLQLDGTGSSDPDEGCGDSIVAYEWDLDNDGEFDDANGVSPTVSWATLDSLGLLYPANPATGLPSNTIHLRVTDSFGLTDTDTSSITIYDNTPTASFTAAPNPAAPMQLTTFVATDSRHGHPSRSIVSYAWDFGDSSTGSGVTATHNYSFFGSYTVTLTVTDDNDPAKTDTATMTVDIDQGNRSPVADADGPYTVETGRALTLDGSGSYDPDAGFGDSIVSYEWDLGNDGSFEYTGAATTVPWADLSGLGLGTHTIGLRVTDSFGLADTDTTTVEIEAVPGIIIVEKQTDPDGAFESFEFSTSYSSNFALTDDQTNESGPLTPGIYSVSEINLPAGWDLTSATCDDGSDPSDIGLDPGETVTVLFINTQQRGTIVVEKQTDPDGAPDSFAFSGAAAGAIKDGEQIVVGNLLPGTYITTELVPAGWTLTDITVDDTNSSGDVNTGTATFQLEPGETIKATFTNTLQRGTIIIEKQTDPDGASDSFTFSGDAAGAIKDGEQIIVSNLAPGAYTSQETVPAGWELTNIECDDDNSTVSLADFRVNFQVEAGETVKATFYNRLPLDYGDAPDSYGTLLASNGARHAIVQGHSLGPIVDAEPDGQPSPLADGDDLNPPGQPDDEDGVTLPPALTAGDPAATITINSGPFGGMLDAWIDFNGNGVFDHPSEHLWGGTSQSLTAGANLPLTFMVPDEAVPGPTYARFRLSNEGGLTPTGFAPDGEVEDYLVEIEEMPGIIIVEKQTDPDGATQSFEFSPSYDPNFTLTDDATHNSGPLAAGVYSVSEINIPAGWSLTSATCDDGSDPSAIGLDPGETVTVLFINTQQRGTIVVEKQTDPDGAPDSFSFNGDVAGSIKDGEQIVVGNLLPGTYTTRETVPAGWNLTSIVLDDDNSSGDMSDGTATFRVEAGETVTAVFTNTLVPQVDLVVSKTDTPDPVTAGSGPGNLTHTVTVTNAGPSDASGVTLSETVSLPAGASIVSITPSGTTSYAPAAASPGTWTVGNLASGASETLTVVMTVDAGTADGAVVSDTATVTSVNETLINTGDDSATENTTVQRTSQESQLVSDLVSMQASGLRYNRRTGVMSSYITITNTSSQVISGDVHFVINSLSDSNVSLVGGDGATAAGTYFDLTAYLNDGRLDPGESVTIRLDFYNPLRRRFTFEWDLWGRIGV